MITINVTDSWDDGKRLHLTGNLVFSGNYTQGGDTANLGLYQIKSASTPEHFFIMGQTPNSYSFVPGSTISNGMIKVFTPTAELSGGPYPNAVLSDFVSFFAILKKLQ